MRLLTIGSDRKLFEEGSAVARRAVRQGEILDAHVIVVFTTRDMPFVRTRLSPRVEVLPTRSRSRLLWGFDALRIGLTEGKGIHLVTTQDPFETGLAGLLLSRFLRAPLLAQAHTDFLDPHFAELSFLNKIRVVLAGIVLPRARLVRAVSRRVARSIERRYGLRAVEVLPVFSPGRDAVDGPRETFGFKRTILVASRLEQEKDVALALRAFARICGDFPGVGLVIAGEGREKPALMAQALRLGIDSAVAFIGWREDLPALRRSASVFLNTSRYEGYGLSLLEAARDGTPIVTTDVGIAGELIEEEDAEIAPVGDTARIAAGLRRALSDETRARARAELLRLKAQRATLTEGSYMERLGRLFAKATATA